MALCSKRNVNHDLILEAATSKDRTQLIRQQSKKTLRGWHLKTKGLFQLNLNPPSQVRSSLKLLGMLPQFVKFLLASSSPAKPRTTINKFDTTSSTNRTVGMIPRRSTTLYEKTSSNEKTNASADNT